jgi:hypothetical protein
MPTVVPPSHVQSCSAQFQPGSAVASSAPVQYKAMRTPPAGEHPSTAWSTTGSSTITPTSRPPNVSPRQYSFAANAAPFENPSIKTRPQPAASTADDTAARAEA